MGNTKQRNSLSEIDIKGIRFKTQRLVLRPFAQGDFEVLNVLHSLKEVVRHLYWDVHSEEETQAMIERRLKMDSLGVDGDKLILAVEEKSSGEFVGDVVLSLTNTNSRQGEVGFIFHPRFHRRGYGYEAAREMLRFGFEDVGLHRIIGRCDARNLASAGLLRKLGLRQEAHLIENEWAKGEWTDELIFAMRRSQWEQNCIKEIELPEIDTQLSSN